jgi:two-component system, sensor histidine kinase RegB
VALSPTSDPVGLSWLVAVRWVSVGAASAAVIVGARVLAIAPSWMVAAVLIGAAAASNIWLAWRIRRARVAALLPGLLVAADVVILSWLLIDAGGLLNPVSIFFVVYIVLGALVLGTAWAWMIALLAVGGYGILFFAPHEELAVAGAMHPEVRWHFAGMWWAFAATALLVAGLVGRLATSVARRDRALADMRERTTRNARLAGLATLAAGAAHELSTPLGTIAVTAGELERDLGAAPTAVTADLALIQNEVRRCRALLDKLAVRAGQPLGAMLHSTTVAAIAREVSAALPAADRPRLHLNAPEAIAVTWPTDALIAAFANLVRNGLQASAPSGTVAFDAAADGQGWVRLTITDRGSGMSVDELSRLGEPFFTTRTEGEGMGLGVFVSRATIEQLGGSIAFDSMSGRGTTVRIRLPRDLPVTFGNVHDIGTTDSAR